MYPDGFTLLRGKIIEYKVRAIRAFSNSTSSDFQAPKKIRKLLRVINIIGQETLLNTNTIQLYIYNDGTAKKNNSVENLSKKDDISQLFYIKIIFILLQSLHQ